MRSERFVPVSDILPCISARVIALNYRAILAAEQMSGMCNGSSARHPERYNVRLSAPPLTLRGVQL